jgi:pimeloyl-ACP methyl ester carboxylesterase
MMSIPSWADAGPRRWPTALFALRREARVSWCMHVPAGFHAEPDAYSLLVAVHGTGRRAQAYRDAFAAHAEANRWVVLAPLFPVGILGDGNADGYKRLIEGDLRYDELLLAMVDELGEALGRTFPTFKLFGFSGGGHFAHRFLYLHPDRLESVCVGAPGGITRIDPELDWPLGTRNVRDLFGVELELAALRALPVQLLVGGDDRMTLPIPPALLERLGDYEPNRAGLNRALYDNYRSLGLRVTRTVVPRIAHEGLRLVGDAAVFLRNPPGVEHD